ncbi:MAG TPA: glycosyl transferase family 2 [Verrucomicrobia subdivision 3 bacterium]|nr:glycosyl transferase family 2 [Limisphaerales bacterium]
MIKGQSPPILSILIVTYKSRDEIGSCLRSLPHELNGRDVEVIVIENGSKDDIGALIRQEFPWVHYMELDKNFGFGKANNLAYEQAKGDFVLFLNPDTISNVPAYEHCLQRLQADPSIGIISPKLVLANGEMDLASRRSIPTVWDGFCRAIGLAAKFPSSRLFAGYNLTYLPDDGTYEVGSVNGAFMLCPRLALLRFGVFDEQFFMYGDDLDLCYRCQRAGYKVIYDGRVKMVHLKGTSSAKESDKMARAVFSSTKQFYLKHFNPHDSAWVKWKYGLLFGLWERFAILKAKLKGHKRARPL